MLWAAVGQELEVSSMARSFRAICLLVRVIRQLNCQGIISIESKRFSIASVHLETAFIGANVRTSIIKQLITFISGMAIAVNVQNNPYQFG